MSQKDWEVRIKAQQAAFESQIQQLQYHLKEEEQTNTNQQSSMKRLEKVYQERGAELDKYKQLYNRAQMFETDYNDLQEKFLITQEENYVITKILL